MGPIRAIYENGVFRPTGPVSLPEGTEVTFEPRVVEPPPEPDEDYDPTALERALAWVESLKHRTPEQIEEANRRMAARSVPLSFREWDRPAAVAPSDPQAEAGGPNRESLERQP